MNAIRFPGRMPRFLFTVLLLMLPLASGCQQQRIDELETANRQLQELNAQLQAEIDQLNEQIRLLSTGDNRYAQRIAELSAQRDALQQALDESTGNIEQMKQRMASLLARGIAVDPELDAALKEFAAAHPNLVTYDSARGMVKFRSDLTFALGSAELTANATSTLRELASLLNSSAGQAYEARVVGHTDSVPISRPATRAKHPTNWHLSVHRAIAVRDALDSAGVPAVRTSVAGYSMYRPLVADQRGGAEANRRVEIYLKPYLPPQVPITGNSGTTATRTPAAPANNAGSTDNVDDMPLK